MISNNNFWVLEARRLLWVLLYGLIFGYITGYLQYCILLVGFGYIGWTLYKLYELQNWLAADQPIEKMPDSNGAWEQIAYLIQPHTPGSTAIPPTNHAYGADYR